jgi:hypothetical protein
VNQLTAQGTRIEDAVRQTWTARRAAELGFTNPINLNATGSPGNYKKIDIIFTK